MTNQQAAQVIYVCGGRNFVGKSPGRKIGGVVDCWRRFGHDVKLICGRDICAEDVSREIEYGSPETFTRWYRRGSVMAPLVATVSEWRDIRHDKLLLQSFWWTVAAGRQSR